MTEVRTARGTSVRTERNSLAARIGPASTGPGLDALARLMRCTILRQSKRANVGHIGSCLSIVEILAVLVGGELKMDGTEAERDRLVLSKGHAALALYAAFHHTNRLEASVIDSFGRDGSILGTHPEHGILGVDFTTGSLGHGLPLGVGAALAARIQRSPRRVFVVMSDAELNEGSTWEAVMFAAHHRLANLVAVIDLNGQQAMGRTRDVLTQSSMAAVWCSFGWDVVEVDGHDSIGLRNAVTRTCDRPMVVLARTTFGKGVSFMEGQLKWHYAPMTDAEFDAAMEEQREPS